MNILKFQKQEFTADTQTDYDNIKIIGTDWSSGDANSSIIGDRGEPGIFDSVRGYRAESGLVYDDSILYSNINTLRMSEIPSSRTIEESNGDTYTIQHYLDILRNLVDVVMALQDSERRALDGINELERRLNNEHTEI